MYEKRSIFRCFMARPSGCALLPHLKYRSLFILVLFTPIFISPFALALQARPITLQETIDIALKQNLDLKLADLEKERGEAYLYDATSRFDLTLKSNMDWTHDQDKPASSISGTLNQTANLNAGLEKKFIFGTKFELNFKNYYKHTDSSFAAKPNYWDPKLELVATHPLLENSFGINDQKVLRSGKKRKTAQMHKYRAQAEKVIAEITKLYWRFAFKKQLVDIQKKAYEDAQNLFRANQKKIKLGTIEKTDLLASHANMLSRKNELLLANNDYKVVLEEFLRTLQVKEPTFPKEDVPFDPETFDFKTSTAFALKHQKAFQEAKENLDAKTLDFNVAKNEKLPTFNFVGSVSGNGLSETYHTALSEAMSFDYPTYVVGAVFAMPLGNDAAQSKAIQTRIEKTNAEIQFQKLQDEIQTKLKTQIETLDTLKEHVQASQAITQLLQKKMIEEEKKFNQGRSSINFVIQFQEDTLNSQKALLQSKLSYTEALIDLKRTRGDFFEAR